MRPSATAVLDIKMVKIVNAQKATTAYNGGKTRKYMFRVDSTTTKPQEIGGLVFAQ